MTLLVHSLSLVYPQGKKTPRAPAWFAWKEPKQSHWNGKDLHAHYFLAEQKKNGTQQAQSGPQVVEGQLLFEVEIRERDENAQGDDFLQNFKLPHRHHLMPDAVGRHLQQVFKQGDAPAN